MTHLELANMARDGAMLARVEYLMVKAAVAKLNAAEPSAQDLLLGQRILDNQERIQSWSIAVCTNPSIASGAHTPDGSTIPDADMEFTINSLWDAFAK